MNNKFNKSRATLPRPKVCKTILPPPVTEDEISCNVQPPEMTLPLFTNANFEFEACNTAVGPSTAVLISIVTELSDANVNGTPFNCDGLVDGFTLTNTFFSGTELVTVTFEFSDLSTCVSTVTVTWT